MVEKILNNTTPYGKIRASHEGSLHSSTLMCETVNWDMHFKDLLGSIARVGYCIPVPDLFLVLHDL